MVKIKDTKIAEKLPEKKSRFKLFNTLSHSDSITTEKIYNEALSEVLNTDIDANECCEVDVEKVTKILTRMGIMGARQTIAEAIAKAGVIKWKEEK